MKDLKKLAAQCEAELKSIGIQPAPVIHYSINTRAVNRWGMCKTIQSGQICEISISARLLQDDLPDQAAKNTIMHELLHSVEGAGSSHTGLWAKLARQVNLLLPHYTIQRTTKSEEKGLAPIPPQYIIECSRCRAQYPRHRMSAVVRQPHLYRCSRCGAPLKRVR